MTLHARTQHKESCRVRLVDEEKETECFWSYMLTVQNSAPCNLQCCSWTCSMNDCSWICSYFERTWMNRFLFAFEHVERVHSRACERRSKLSSNCAWCPETGFDIEWKTTQSGHHSLSIAFYFVTNYVTISHYLRSPTQQWACSGCSRQEPVQLSTAS